MQFLYWCNVNSFVFGSLNSIIPYKARLISNSSSSTTTELSKLYSC